MKLFSSCNDCCVCVYGDGCVAGNGDDYFRIASKEQIINNLDCNKFPSSAECMMITLKAVYGYKYDIHNIGCKENTDILKPLVCITEDEINELFQ